MGSVVQNIDQDQSQIDRFEALAIVTVAAFPSNWNCLAVWLREMTGRSPCQCCAIIFATFIPFELDLS